VRTTKDREPSAQALAGSHDRKRMNIVDRILLSEVIAKLPEGYRDHRGIGTQRDRQNEGHNRGHIKITVAQGKAYGRGLIT